MLTDTHAHLDFEADDVTVDGVLMRARDAGVTRVVTVGTSLERSRRGVAIAGGRDNVWTAVGVHPDAAETVNGETVAQLEALAAEPKVVAIGETGLDLFHADNPPLDIQRQAFRAQAELAARVKLPLIVHSRAAHEETLTELAGLAGDLPGERPGVLHCFEGDRHFADRVLALGCFISFTANITYPKNESLREVVKHVPLEKMLLETDAPFLPPQGKRGERNESAAVRVTAELVAELKEISLEEVAAQTSANADRLFGLAG